VAARPPDVCVLATEVVSHGTTMSNGRDIMTDEHSYMCQWNRRAELLLGY